jgi:hypothetical protein
MALNFAVFRKEDDQDLPSSEAGHRIWAVDGVLWVFLIKRNIVYGLRDHQTPPGLGLVARGRLCVVAHLLPALDHHAVRRNLDHHRVEEGRYRPRPARGRVDQVGGQDTVHLVECPKTAPSISDRLIAAGLARERDQRSQKRNQPKWLYFDDPRGSLVERDLSD